MQSLLFLDMICVNCSFNSILLSLDSDFNTGGRFDLNNIQMECSHAGIRGTNKNRTHALSLRFLYYDKSWSAL